MDYSCYCLHHLASVMFNSNSKPEHKLKRRQSGRTRGTKVDGVKSSTTFLLEKSLELKMILVSRQRWFFFKVLSHLLLTTMWAVMCTHKKQYIHQFPLMLHFSLAECPLKICVQTMHMLWHSRSHNEKVETCFKKTKKSLLLKAILQ